MQGEHQSQNTKKTLQRFEFSLVGMLYNACKMQSDLYDHF